MGKRTATIQAKLQRSAKKTPLTADRAAGLWNPEQYVVETQKSRAGLDALGASTRPYRFGEFDILAVSLEPLTRDWSIFRFTLSRWLLPDPGDQKLMRKYQPVSFTPDDDWTDNLETCLEWLASDVQKTIQGAENAEHTKQKRRRKRE